MEPLPTILRLHVYGLHGYFAEVIFTAVWEFILFNNWKFPGCSSIWSLPIYSISTLVMEFLYLRLKDHCNIVVRGCIYTLWIFCWEFSWGLLLTQFDACPWDYTHFDNDIIGLITLDYAPVWFMASLFNEQLLIQTTLRLRMAPVDDAGNADFTEPETLNHVKTPPDNAAVKYEIVKKKIMSNEPKVKAVRWVSILILCLAFAIPYGMYLIRAWNPQPIVPEE